MLTSHCNNWSKYMRLKSTERLFQIACLASNYHYEKGMFSFSSAVGSSSEQTIDLIALVFSFIKQYSIE